MGSYLQQYFAEEERRNRVVKWIVLGCILAVIVVIALYLIFHNFAEKQVVKHFLVQVNARDYQAAYSDWGCTAGHPCPNYDYNRFMEDWGPSKKIASPWKIASVDGC